MPENDEVAFKAANVTIAKAILADLRYGEQPLVLKQLVDDIGFFVSALTFPPVQAMYQAAVQVYIRSAPKREPIRFSDIVTELELAGETPENIAAWQAKFNAIEKKTFPFKDAAAALMNHYLRQEILREGKSWMERVASQKSDVREEVAGFINSLVNLTLDGHQESRPKSILEEARRLGIPMPEPTGYALLDKDWSNGWHPGWLTVWGSPSGHGKAQPLYANVLTPTGWKKMGDIHLGDAVISPNGLLSVVTHIFPQGQKEIFKVSFVDGRQVEATGDHLWEIRSAQWDEPKARVLTTNEVARLLKTKYIQDELYVPLMSGDYGVEKDLPIDSYVLGVLIGDGALSHGVCFCKPDTQVAEEVSKRLLPDYELRSTGMNHRIVRRNGSSKPGHSGSLSNHYIESLREMGLWDKHSDERFIPEPYLQATKSRRLDLLRGLLDTDGTVQKAKVVEFSTTSERLARNVQELVWSLGGISKITTKQSFYRNAQGEKIEGRLAYRVSVRHPHPETLMFLDRKRNRAKGNQYAGNLKLRITAIEPAGTTECQCIRVSRPDGLYVTDNYIVTHNSAAACNFAVERAKQHRPILINSFEMSSVDLLLRMLCNLANVNIDIARKPELLTTREEYEAFRASEDLLNNYVRIYDQPCSVTEIEQRVRRHKAEFGPSMDMFELDHIGIVGEATMNQRSNQQADWSRLEQTAYALKGICKRNNTSALVFSQVDMATRKELIETNKTTAGGFRGSAGIYNAVDMAIISCRHNGKVNGKFDPRYYSVTCVQTQKMRETGNQAYTLLQYDPTYYRLLDKMP